jgi:hypothetical protein
MLSKSKKSKTSSPKRVASRQVVGSSKVLYKPMSPKKNVLKIGGVNMFDLNSWSSFAGVATMPMFPFLFAAPLLYPPGFDICGYAKEIYDANRNKPAFKDKHFHTAMTYYSFIFCYEKELRVLAKTKMMWQLQASTIIEGIEKALHKAFKKCEKLLVKANAVEIGKNKEIKEVHIKNITELIMK